MQTQSLSLDNQTMAALPLVLPSEKQKLLTRLLRSVSRSFYLTLRVLPAGMREPVSLAYLLARAADTLADTPLVEDARRIEVLEALRQGMADSQSTPDFRQFLATRKQHSATAELRLIQQIPKLFSLLATQTPEENNMIRQIVTSLIDGMLLDIRRFPISDQQHIKALQDASELEHYCYQVAGCVGEFWTQMALRHVAALPQDRAAEMLELGINFGKALQLTNVLRDLPRDLRNGRCYLPMDELQTAGLTPSALCKPETIETLAPVLNRWLLRNLELFEHAMHYFQKLPRRCLRLRLAALWPILIGLRTLSRLGSNAQWLEHNRVVKVKRYWIYSMLIASLPAIFSNTLCLRWMRHYSDMTRAGINP